MERRGKNRVVDVCGSTLGTVIRQPLLNKFLINLHFDEKIRFLNKKCNNSANNKY